ncbi:hypothetical protein ACFQGE_09150 [Halomicroarcula sp. GCM10025817]|uniref:hypothetical protein n=1 Tax=Haloarcula TaxID=2237 RepID=UPI0023E790D3|nr:hypothetical protein [Halomicroarcula sp. SYNS111]
MTLRVGAALADGLDDLLSRRGVTVLGVFLVYSLLNTVLWQSASPAIDRSLAAVLPGATRAPPAVPTQSPLALDLSLGAVFALLVVLFAAGELLRILAIRLFASEADVFDPAVTADLGPTMVTALVAAVLTAVAVALGTLVFVLPGVVLALLFFFVRQEIALNDSGVLEAIRESIRLVTDNAVPVLALAAVLFVLGVVVSLPLQLVGIPGQSLAVTLVTTALSQLVTVFGIAVVTSAYRRVATGHAPGPAPSIDEAL